MGEEKTALYDKDGNLFIDEDPNDFVYILKALRNTGKTSRNDTPRNLQVPEGSIYNVRDLDFDLAVNAEGKCMKYNWHH